MNRRDALRIALLVATTFASRPRISLAGPCRMEPMTALQPWSMIAAGD